MKKIVILLVACLTAFTLKAQSEQRVSAEISYNHAKLSFRQSIESTKIWINPYFGLAKADIDKKFNDAIFGIKAGYTFAELSKSTFSIDATLGGYIPNNKQYNAPTFIMGLGIDYSLKISKNGKHMLIASLGYQYGKRSYKQTFSNNSIYIETTDTFKVPAISMSVGYAFKL